jgi:sensor histidine kinase YesM
MRLARSSGIVGLAGMAFVSHFYSRRPTSKNQLGLLLVRPLLQFSKQDLYTVRPIILFYLFIYFLKRSAQFSKLVGFVLIMGRVCLHEPQFFRFCTQISLMSVRSALFFAIMTRYARMQVKNGLKILQTQTARSHVIASGRFSQILSMVSWEPCYGVKYNSAFRMGLTVHFFFITSSCLTWR